jgi:hypothetical protein
VFPLIMLISYISLGFYFKGRGGYKAVELEGGDDDDSDSTDTAGADAADSEDEKSDDESDEESKDD